MNNDAYQAKLSSLFGEKVYHYTNLDGVKGIISSGQLWITQTVFLNDKEELVNGYKFFKKLCEEKENDSLKFFTKSLNDLLNNSNAFVVSFCEKKDLLSQWRAYSHGEVGYCLEFEKTSLHKKCFYTEKEKKDYFSILAEDKPEGESHCRIHFNNVLEGIIRCKHEGFHEEKEFRICIFEHENIKERFINGKKVRYIEHKIDYAELLAVWIGPCEESEIKKVELKQFLQDMIESDSCGLNHMPEIKISDLPYRPTNYISMK